jgi:hypothetical protein
MIENSRNLMALHFRFDFAFCGELRTQIRYFRIHPSKIKNPRQLSLTGVSAKRFFSLRYQILLLYFKKFINLKSRISVVFYLIIKTNCL